MRTAVRAVLIAACISGFAPAATLGAEDTRMLIEAGSTVRFSVRKLPPGELPAAGKALEPVSAINTSTLLHAYLADAQLDAAAALSNSPDARLAMLRDYVQAVGIEPFKRTFREYMQPPNRPVAEISVGTHRLLVWQLTPDRHLIGEFFAERDGRVLLDDTPGPERAQLERVLDALRADRLKL